jgi:hypothetical protein
MEILGRFICPTTSPRETWEIIIPARGPKQRGGSKKIMYYNVGDDVYAGDVVNVADDDDV